MMEVQYGEYNGHPSSYLESAERRDALYHFKGKFASCENPAFKLNGNSYNAASRLVVGNKSSSFGGMTKKDFLSSVPTFSDFSNDQLSLLVEMAKEKVYKKGVSYCFYFRMIT